MSAVTYYYCSISALISLQFEPCSFFVFCFFFRGLACQNSSAGWDRARSCPSLLGEEAWRCAKAPVCRKTWLDAAASMTLLLLSAALEGKSRTFEPPTKFGSSVGLIGRDHFFFSSSPLSFVTSQTSPDISRPPCKSAAREPQ